MAQTVAQIAKKAFDAVAKAIPDAIGTCTLSRADPDGTYSATDGEYYADADTTWTGRSVIATASAVKDIFPDYVAGPSDVLIFLEGLSQAPAENDEITIGTKTRHVMDTGDIVGAGTFFAVMAR